MYLKHAKSNLIAVSRKLCPNELFFVDRLVNLMSQRKTQLTSAEFNEYLYQIYKGVETRTGICLWHYDNGLCHDYFDPNHGAKDTLIWVIDLINSSGVCSEPLEKAILEKQPFETLPWSENDLKALGRVYFGAFNPYDKLNDFYDLDFLSEF